MITLFKPIRERNNLKGGKRKKLREVFTEDNQTLKVFNICQQKEKPRKVTEMISYSQ